MKIRIKSGSLRYRLTRSEVALFEKEGMVNEEVIIGGNTLIYNLQRSNDDALSASFNNNIITLKIPQSMADEWTGTDRVGFSGNDRGLYLLVEKDFTCLDNVDEDQSDNYPNPLALKEHE